MKKIRNLLLAVLIVSIMPLVNAIAQDTDYSASYDFNDYEGEMSSGVTPGEDWSYFSGGNAFGASDGAMKLNWGAKPALHLKNPVNCVSPTDAMHISFRAKVVTGGQLFVGTAKNNGNHDDDITKVDVFGRARHNMIKISKSTVTWDKSAGDGGCTTYAWTRPDDGTDWHRYDMVRKSDGSWTYFVDGVNIMTDIGICKEYAWGGFHGSAFSYIYFFENSSGSYIDDVKVRVQKGSFSGLELAKLGDARVERDYGVLELSLSEPVFASDIIKENISVSNNVTGDVVTDFEVEVSEFNGLSDSFKINFGANTLTSGEYTVSVSDSVVGLLTGTSIEKDFTFKPAYKETDGVVHPEAESVKFIGIDGKEVNLSDNMNAGVKEIVITFNTIISEENIDSYIVLNDESGKVSDLSYTVEETDGRSVLKIGITNLLKPYEEYSFVINKGIPSSENSNVKSESDDFYSFKTAMPDEGGEVFGITSNEVLDNKYCFGIAKTTDVNVKLWAVAAVYKTVTNDSGEEFEMLFECKCIPVVLDAEDKGVFEFEKTFETDLSQGDFSVKTYISEYPNLLAYQF